MIPLETDGAAAAPTCNAFISNLSSSILLVFNNCLQGISYDLLWLQISSHFNQTAGLIPMSQNWFVTVLWISRASLRSLISIGSSKILSSNFSRHTSFGIRAWVDDTPSSNTSCVIYGEGGVGGNSRNLQKFKGVSSSSASCCNVVIAGHQTRVNFPMLEDRSYLYKTTGIFASINIPAVCFFAAGKM